MGPAILTNRFGVDKIYNNNKLAAVERYSVAR